MHVVFEVDQMRVLITGGAGLLGGTLVRSAPPGVELHATQRRTPVPNAVAHTLDLADRDAVNDTWRRVRPDVVIHAAYAMDASEREITDATTNVVRACAESGAGLVHVSTDVVLDGEGSPYDEDAAPDPVHEYGRRKADAERMVHETLPKAAIVRTSLIIRPDPPDRTTGWVLQGLRNGTPVRLFTDELRCPIAVEDLAGQLWEVAALPGAERGGMWNLAGPEAISRYALGLLIARRFALDPAGIIPGRHAESPSPRPRDLRLLTTRADRSLGTKARPVSLVLAAP